VELGLEGRAVLVTGGSDGLGLGLCRRLLAEGALVALCGRDRARLDAAAESLGSSGGDVLAVQADVAKADDVARFVDAAVDRWGRLDGLVNNAGQSAAGPVIDTDDALWRADLDLKLFAAVRFTRLVVPHLAARGGAIVNTLAVAAKAPGAHSAPSSVSRAAGLALTKTLSKELGGRGIRVNAVLIGLMESGQWARWAERSQTPLAQMYEQMGRESGIPLGRVGRAEEYGDLVSFLLSDRAAYISGAAINLDGGLCAVG
jgi:NAD(P)-dependent dehydrogenase (short-subunit alcohol dehydrogenase family)